MLRQEKRDPCHSVRSVTKVSSEHMTSGIAAVMTLPCSGLPEKALTGGLPFTPLYHFY